MTAASLRGVGFWASGLPGWDAARAFVADGTLPEGVARKPAPELLAPNERRRAPDTVALALEVALQACRAADADPRTLPSVFASTHGELAITDYICSTLANDPRGVSPIRFHNSVHNAAAGYWTIGTGCMRPATAVSAYRGSFAQGLLEAFAQLADGEPAVLLVAYDAASLGPLAAVSASDGLLAAALLLSTEPAVGAPRVAIELEQGVPADAATALARRYAGNAMAPMLPLLDLLAADATGDCGLLAGRDQQLRVTVQR